MTKMDNRKSKRGSSIRKKFAAKEKANIMQKYEECNPPMTIRKFCQGNNSGDQFLKYLSKGKEGWRNPETHEKLLKKRLTSDAKTANAL